MVHALYRLALVPLVLILAIAAAIAFYKPFPTVLPWHAPVFAAEARLAALADPAGFKPTSRTVVVVIDAAAEARTGLWASDERALEILKTQAGIAGAAQIRLKTERTSAKLSVSPDIFGTIHVLPAMDLIHKDPAAISLIDGATVVIGRARTPAELSELKMDAAALSFAAKGLHFERPDWAFYAEIAAGLFLALGGALFANFGRGRLAAAVLATGSLIFAAAAFGVFWLQNWLIDPVLPALFAAAGIALAGAGYRLRVAGVRSWLTRRMGAKPPAPLVRAAVLNPDAVSLVAKSTEITVLAVRLRDTAALAKTYRARPDILAKLVRRVMTTAADIARAHGGTIERVSGDRLVVYWNAPLEEPKHAERACDCALAILGRMQPINDTLEKHHDALGLGFVPVQVAMGIETGPAFVGQTGRESAGDFSVLGMPLERALENCERVAIYGPAILVGRETRGLVHKQFALLPLDLLAGEETVRVRALFALLGNPLLRANPRFKALQEGMGTFLRVYAQGQFAVAAKLLEHCAKLPGINERTVSLYRERLQILLAAPPEHWEGVFPPGRQ